MNGANCSRWATELVECARAGSAPCEELRQHLQECGECAARWTGQRNLSAHFRAVKEAAVASRPAAARRERLLREFVQMRRRRVHPAVRWALAAAAMLVLTIGAGLVLRQGALRPSRAGDTPGMQASNDAAPAEVPEAEEGFVGVPFAPPLAPGELVRVVHAELGPVELARMGVVVEDLDAGEIPADVVVGEDGFPRAVRVSEEGQE